MFEENVTAILPELEKMYEDGSENSSDFTLEELRSKCCAYVSIKYSTIDHVKNEYVAAVTGMDALCNIGGLMGMWIGISFLNIYDMAVEVFEKVIYYCRKAFAKYRGSVR